MHFGGYLYVYAFPFHLASKGIELYFTMEIKLLNLLFLFFLSTDCYNHCSNYTYKLFSFRLICYLEEKREKHQKKHSFDLFFSH